MGLFEGGIGVIRGEVWVNTLAGTLACCNTCGVAAVCYMYLLTVYRSSHTMLSLALALSLRLACVFLVQAVEG
jgi:multisubunit Na+/H+ antiporter MnhF subunit